MDAWISPPLAPWFSLFAFSSFPAVLAVFVRRGQLRGLVTVVWSAVALLGVVMLAAALVGAVIGQPWWVLVALGVPGLVMSLVYGWAALHLRKAYGEAEMRRSMAKDI